MKTIACFCLLVFLVTPQLSLACRPGRGSCTNRRQPKRNTTADLVISGRVVRMKAVDGKAIGVDHPSTFVLTIQVDKWLKGRGQTRLKVFDTAGTDCDPLYGTNHVVTTANPESFRWTLFIRKFQGRNWIATADETK